jgi:tetratricopeptide (TPR) repeat protein
LQERSTQLIEQRSYSEAADKLQRSLTVCSNHEQVLLELAKAQMLSLQFDAALASLHQLLADDPANVQAFITQGQVFYFINKDSDAESSLMQAIHIVPRDAEPHYWLGRIYYSDSRLEEATGQFQEALKLNPDAYKAYDGLALCYENKGDMRLTVQTYMNGIALVYKNHPHYDVIYADFAEFLLKYGDSQKAFSVAGEAATRNPLEPRNFFLAGKAAEQAGKYDVSIRWLTKAAELDPTYPDPHYLLARIYRRTGDIKASAEESTKFQALLAKAPQVRR